MFRFKLPYFSIFMCVGFCNSLIAGRISPSTRRTLFHGVGQTFFHLVCLISPRVFLTYAIKPTNISEQNFGGELVKRPERGER
jgi:hypothetical protein